MDNCHCYISLNLIGFDLIYIIYKHPSESALDYLRAYVRIIYYPTHNACFSSNASVRGAIISFTTHNSVIGVIKGCQVY